jgi:hypothetical protein
LTLYIKQRDVRKIVPKKKSTTIELSLIDEPIKEEKPKPKEVKKEDNSSNETLNKPKELPSINKALQKTASKSTKKTANISSLFGSVTTKTPRKKEISIKKDVLNIQRNDVASRFKSNISQEKRSDISSVSNLVQKINKASSLKLSFSKDGVSDEYYSKVYDILSKSWIPSAGGKDLFVKVMLTIYKNGEFEYRVLKDSNEQIFNNSVINFLNRMKNIRLPSHNKSKFVNIEVTFKRED